ncbi:hypothetical protein IT575_11370 [bacterium]|nr:hypothetical protein [bacterium]
MLQPEEELITVFHANSEFEGISIRDLLLQNGIPTILTSASGASGYLNVYMGTVLWHGEVQVYARDAEKAEELVCGFLGTLGMLEEAEPEPEQE